MMASVAIRRSFLALSVLCFTVVLTGCGGHDFGPTGKISGRLTLEGKPMAPGHAVSFMQPEKGFLAFGFTDAEGNFSVGSWNEGDMPVGKYSVMIAPPAATAPAVAPTADEAFENPELVDPKLSSVFPVKYRDITTSGLEFDVVAGDNKFEVELKAQ